MSQDVPHVYRASIGAGSHLALGWKLSEGDGDSTCPHLWVFVEFAGRAGSGRDIEATHGEPKGLFNPQAVSSSNMRHMSAFHIADFSNKRTCSI